MIRPRSLSSDAPHGPWSCRGTDIWETLRAAGDGDARRLSSLLEHDPNLYRAEYWYTQPIHFAVRDGHLDAVRVLLDAGADPGWRSLSGDDLLTTARDRGHAEVAELLLESLGRTPRTDHDLDDLDGATPSAIHEAATRGDATRLEALLADNPVGLHAPDPAGHTPLRLAVAASAPEAVRKLLELGADPNHPEGPEAPRGVALYLAARDGNEALARLLLAHGADPNATIDSAGSATFAARTLELRELLIEHGGLLDPYDLVFLDEDEEALRRVREDPDSAGAGCGGVLAAASKLGKRDLVERLLDAGARVPSSLTGCRSYLWCDPEILEKLLDSGMDPDLPDWLHATPLHSLCGRDGRGRPRPHRIECAKRLVDAGADLSPRDEDYRSTPLGWAARNGLGDMVDFLLARGAPVEPADGPAWSTPLAWARRRGHERLAERLVAAGAAR